MYSVSDAAKMLNVNEETVRRWIRDGKLQAKRAVGRGGNTLYLEDIITFANQPPRAYLLSLESWLNEHDIAYKKIEDSSVSKKGTGAAAATAVAGAGVTAAAAGAGVAATGAGITSVASAGFASAAAAAGPIGLGVVGVAGIAYGAAKLMKRKNYQKYSIQLVPADEAEKCTAIGLPPGKLEEQSSPEISPCVGPQNPDSKEASSSDSDADLSDSTPASTPLNVLKEIACAKQLLDSGVITAEEFVDIKARLIAKI